MNAADSRIGLEETSCTFSTTRHVRSASDWASTCNSWRKYLTMSCRAEEPLLSACQNRLAEPRRSSAPITVLTRRGLVFLVFFLRRVRLGLVVFLGILGVLRIFCVFGVFRFFCAAVALGRRGRSRGTGALLRVIGHVPARTFELHGWSRDHLLDDASAFGALSQLLIRAFPALFKAVCAVLAQVFVVGHR